MERNVDKYHYLSKVTESRNKKLIIVERDDMSLEAYEKDS